MFAREFYILVLMAAVVTCIELGDILSRQKRVVGGAPYTKGEYPFHVSLWYMGANNKFTEMSPDLHHTCGGVLIDPSWVLTSAACFDDNHWIGMSNPSKWKVYLGMHAQRDAEDNAQYRQIAEIIKSPDYDTNSVAGDIALLKLSEPATLSEKVGLVKINKDSNCPVQGQHLEVIGWGQTNPGGYGPGSNIPHKATVQAESLRRCRNAYFNGDFKDHTQHLSIDHKNLCASVPTGGKDGCAGDSGSPLLATCRGQKVVVATVSFGIGCGLAQYPSVNTRVSAYADWILKTID